MKINIRKAEKSDLKAVHHLVRALAIYEKAEAEFVATLSDYEQNWEKGVFECIVAEVEEEIVGMTLYYLTYSTWKGRMLYLEDFVVLENYRKLGIGQLLFDATRADARAKGCALMKWQVLDWNTTALNFYDKNNAIIEKEWWNGKILLEK
ncbi:MAG: GNAT family N-acetyltransferase [Bacteroidota bacterium]